MSLTAELADFAIRTPSGDLGDGPQDVVLNSLLDWIAVGHAGTAEPVARIVRELALQEGGAPVASTFGDLSIPPRAAALVNGATSHALDYDDTHFHHVGHLSVVVIPAALAIAEARQVTGRALADALAIGFEVACRVGGWLGRAHYDAGFHQTATAGTFGATAAACRLFGMGRDRARHALGLAATRAAGLRAQFGTMGKPLNAGFAAAAAVECATLAALGAVSTPEGLEGPQGFGATHAGGAGPVPHGTDTFLMRTNSYKFHACCHGTHAALEALEAALREVPPDRVAAITLRTHPRWLPVCNIEHPTTGLEVKFSYRHVLAMRLAGRDTGSPASFEDRVATDPEITRLAGRIRVEPDPDLADTEARLLVEDTDGRRLEVGHDIGRPLRPEEVRDRLRRKARALLGAQRAAAAEAVVDALVFAPDVDALGALVRGA